MATITYAQANAVLKYDPVTGKLFWKVRPIEMFHQCGPHSPEIRANLWNRRYAGREALTSKNSSGYYHGSIFNRSHKAHRVAWLLHYGKWPEYTLDHINGNPADNRIENLRDVPHAVNQKNMKRRSDNKTLITGVNFVQGKWVAAIHIDGRFTRLGAYCDKDTAVMVRKAAERKYGYHANHGRSG